MRGAQVLAIATAFGAVGFVSMRAAACSCLLLETSARNAAIVFEGTATSVDQVEGTLITHFEVLRYWKGNLGETLDVISMVPGLGNCGVEFTVGATGIHYMDRYADLCMGKTNLCSSLAGHDPDELGEGNAPGTGPARFDDPDSMPCVPKLDAGIPISPLPDPPLIVPQTDAAAPAPPLIFTPDGTGGAAGVGARVPLNEPATEPGPSSSGCSVHHSWPDNARGAAALLVGLVGLVRQRSRARRQRRSRCATRRP